MHALAGRIVRIATVCSLLTVVLTSASAAQFTAGVKGGLSVANFTGNDVEDTGWLTGFATGVFLTYNFVENLVLQPELLYVQKGATFDITEQSQTFTADFLLDYVEIPVLLRLNVPVPVLARRTSIHLLAGPSIAFRSSCEVKGTAGAITVTADCEDSTLGLPVKNVDWSMIGGAGIGLTLSDATFFLEGRYHIGLTTIDDSTPAEDVYNQAFAIMAGVSIPFGRRPVVSASR